MRVEEECQDELQGSKTKHTSGSKMNTFLNELTYFPVLKVKVKSLSRVRLFVQLFVRLFATPGTVAYQAPRSMGFSRQEYWSGLPFPSPGDLPDQGIEPGSPAL